MRGGIGVRCGESLAFAFLVIFLAVGPTTVAASNGDSGWGIATPIGLYDGGNISGFVQLAVDPGGEAIAVWSQMYGSWGANRSGPRSDILANRFVPGEGWGTPIAIDTGEGGVLDMNPRVVMDSLGDGLVVWDSCPPPPPYNYVCTTIRAARFVHGVGWGLPETVVGWVPGQGSVWVYDFAIDGRGMATILWGDTIDLWATRSLSAGGWEAPTLLGDAGIAWSRLATSPDGTAVAAWTFHDGNTSSVWANQYLPSHGWGEAVRIDSGWHERVGDGGPDLAMTPDGVAFAVWDERSGNRTDVFSARLIPGGRWERATRVGINAVGPSTRAQGAQIGVDTNGDAVALWLGVTGEYSPFEIIANRYVPGVGWGASVSIAKASHFPQDFITPDFAHAVDGQGNVFVVYSESQRGTFATRYTPGSGWGEVTKIGAGAPNCGPCPPAVAVDLRGDVIAAWHQLSPNSSNVWAVRYVAPSAPSPPPVPPSLVLSSPAAPLTNDPYVTVSGTTDPGAGVTVDGTPVAVGPTGAFAYTVKVPDGPHTFLARATGASGGITERTLTVVVDTRAPWLALISPANETTTDEVTVTVSGTTEPGATLVANGVLVAVSADGSFRFLLALSEGRNAVSVTSMDAAGNSATAVSHVTYLRSETSLPDPSRWELASTQVWVAAFVALTAVLAAVLVSLLMSYRRVRHGKGESRETGSAALTPEIRSDPPIIPAARTGRAAKGLTALEVRWNNGGPVRLTTKERVLLHLLPYAKYIDAAEVPPAVTLRGISESAGVDPRHFSQYARPLVRGALLRERTAHVRGVVPRRKVYVLTEAGRVRAAGIRERLKTVTVRVRDAAGVREAPIAEVLTRLRDARILDIARAANVEGVVDLEDGSD